MVAPPPMARPVAMPAIAAMNGAIGIRRLTRFEYGNTISDLLGVKNAENDIEEDDSTHFLSNNQNAMRVGQADLEAYERAANKVTNLALPMLKLPAGCLMDTLAGDCVDKVLAEFLPRAFRRPASDAEIKRYSGLFARLAPDGTRTEALRGALQAILLSPSFLYRTELGSDGRNLNSWEMASRLSYLVWGSMPDAELFARAKDDMLRTPAQLDAQLRRLLADVRAQRGLLNIVYEWFGLHGAQVAKKGKDVLMGLSTNLQVYLDEETRRFVTSTLLGTAMAPGSFEALYTAKYSFLNDSVAAVYGQAGVTGKDFRRVELDPTKRRGLFTQPLLLAAHTKESGYSVVQMGRFVRERLLCQEVPPPPPNAVTEIMETPANANLTYREKFEQHATDPTCRACHQILDPPGFAYLTFDPIGRFKAADARAVPFDTKGTLVGVDDKSVPFTTTVTMLDAVAASQDSKGCFARKFTEYVFGRTLAKADLPLYGRLVNRLEDKGDFVTFLSDIITSKDFTVRGPDEAR